MLVKTIHLFQSIRQRRRKSLGRLLGFRSRMVTLQLTLLWASLKFIVPDPDTLEGNIQN